MELGYSSPQGNGDEVKYPELYRKSEYVKGSNYDLPKPFQVATIKEVFSKPSAKITMETVVMLRLRMFYR